MRCCNCCVVFSGIFCCEWAEDPAVDVGFSCWFNKKPRLVAADSVGYVTFCPSNVGSAIQVQNLFWSRFGMTSPILKGIYSKLSDCKFFLVERKDQKRTPCVLGAPKA